MKVQLPPADDDPRQRKALLRFSVVQAIQQRLDSGLSFSQAVQQVALQCWEGFFFSPSTIENWFYRFRDGQFQALYNQPRKDRGHHRSLEPHILDALLQYRRAHPTLALKALVVELINRQILAAGSFSYSTRSEEHTSELQSPYVTRMPSSA